MTDHRPTRAPAAPRAFEAIVEQVRARIASGELKAGDKLLPEREMAEQFGVGRNVVREAIRSLEIAGVVRLQKGRNGGAYVRPASATRVTHAMRDLMDFGSIGWADLTEARTMVLDMVVRLASERATDADFEALERNVEATEELTLAGQFEQRRNVAYEFYTLLTTATRNPTLVLLVTAMSQLVRRFADIARQEGRKPVATLVTSRRRFLKLLRSGQVDAAVAEMRAHLLNVHANLDTSAPRPHKPRASAKPDSARRGGAAAATRGG